MYVWQREVWPDFRWSAETLLGPLAAARHRQGLLRGRIAQLGFELRGTAQLQAATEEALKSSDIEGEQLDRASVRSSVARRLGVKLGGLTLPEDPKTEGVVEMTLDATQGFARPLTRDRLFGWQAALFTGPQEITVGDFRTGAMRVVSAHRVHFEAPPAKRLPGELKRFLRWFEKGDGDGLIHAGLAHLWLVTLHPFDDGNGRVARAVTDLALARLEGRAERFYSLSSQLRRERKAYYAMLERTQRGSLDVTPWLAWFIESFAKAIDLAEDVVGDALARADLGRKLGQAPVNERQRALLGKLLAGLDGKLTAKRWAALARTSADTAQRDLKELVELRLLVKNPGGSKNTSYALAL